MAARGPSLLPVLTNVVIEAGNQTTPGPFYHRPRPVLIRKLRNNSIFILTSRVWSYSINGCVALIIVRLTLQLQHKSFSFCIVTLVTTSVMYFNQALWMKILASSSRSVL